MSRIAVRSALVSVLLLAAACGADRREAERVVRAYNDAAILAYRTRDFGPLQEVATKGEWGRVVVLVDLKTASRLVLESELQSLEIVSVARPSPDAMVVRSRERWSYHDRPLDPGRPQGQRFVADMVLEYQFAREGGRWKLDRAKTISTEYLEPKGARPGAGHVP
jgi:hypothetical protein